MAEVAGLKPDQLRALDVAPEWNSGVHLAAARYLEQTLDARDAPAVTSAHEQWIRDARAQFDTVGAFMQWVLTVSGDLRGGQ
ncbi:hypothetical protein ACFFH7_35660 [Kutzneria chonburiensis]|uniref:Uncharacterized protein n=2 Tax=Kutzneria chonburiensis TaxID=1483604 RepID=A0ABV6N2S9_9PSEU|nr:hypothetical protein [Kutzneria chonburiensis]